MKAQKGGEFMKSRTLIMITATIITCAAIVLTSGLSLLHGWAFESTPDQSPATNDENVNVENNDATVDEIVDEEIIIPEATDDEAAPEAPVVPEKPEYDYPDFEYKIVNAKDIHYCGCNKGPHSSHADLIDGVTIDIYSHKTGKLVGQLAIDSEDIFRYISKQISSEFDYNAQTFEPDTDDEVVNLPKGDYRIEVYAGVWFSYTYGNNTMFELTQCTLTFYGGEIATGYIDYLIADYIAEIEAGNVEAPDPEMAVSKLEFNGLEGYWYGHWIEGGGYLPGYMWEGAGRFTERFPYVEE